TVPPGTVINVESNKTIIGADAASGITGGGFVVSGTFTAFKENVIFQNLVVALPSAPADAIMIQWARHVLIDHCDLHAAPGTSEAYGFLVNIKHGSDYITVSWNRIPDDYNTYQIGHTDGNMAEDTGHLTVTSHHNLIQLARSGSPRVRFGTVHVFNNH